MSVLARPIESVDLPTRRGRWVRTGAVLAGAGLRPRTSRRAAVCAAARLLTALGVRVEVRAPATAWPRVRPGGAGLLVVANSVSALDHLALVTAVPGVVAVDGGKGGRTLGALRLPTVPSSPSTVAEVLRQGTTVTVRPERHQGMLLDRFDQRLFAAAVETGATVCPVAVRHRIAGDARRPAAAGTLLRELPGVVATAGLVVELHLLPPVTVAADALELATLAEYAVAEALERGPISAR